MVAKVALVVAVSAGLVGGTQRAVPVLVSSRSEEGPAASHGWLAWMESSQPNPSPPWSTTAVYARRSNGHRFRVGPRNRYAQTGGLDGRRLVLQVYDAFRSRIGYADLPETRVRYYGPTINTKLWQWHSRR